jgi:GntR family transcriptional regulator/MocR family aminotransferase
VNLEIEFQRGIPLRRQLERALRDAIRSGRLSAGAELPPSRELADQLGISRGVVVDCYGQLIAEGYLSARQGSRTRVAQLPEPLAPPPPRALDARPRFRYDLRPGQVDVHAFPRARWQSALLGTLRTLPDSRLTYGTPRGAPELRNAVAEHVRRMRGVAAEPDDVLICTAASHGLSLIWRVLARAGARRIAIEDPSWRWQRYTVEEAGLEAVPIRVDEAGLVVDELVAAHVDAVVVTPAHQFPTGVVLSPERRRELVTWAQSRGALIVEDDYDVEYRYDREPISALQGLAPDHVAFVGTTSKTLSPALRLAWVVPPQRLLEDLGAALRATGITPPTLDQVALASFIADSGLERHLRRMRKHYAEKRRILVDALARELPDVRVGGASAGLHLIAWLPADVDEHAAGERARRFGVGLHELHYHCTTVAPRPPAFVLGYAMLSPSDLEEGTRLLARAVEEARTRERAPIGPRTRRLIGPSSGVPRL